MRCPSCGSSYFFPSRPRNLLERLRQQLSNRTLYRCRKCEHRLWWDGASSSADQDLPDEQDSIADDPVEGDDYEEMDDADEPDLGKPPS
jgi:hypothetical protein